MCPQLICIIGFGRLKARHVMREGSANFVNGQTLLSYHMHTGCNGLVDETKSEFSLFLYRESKITKHCITFPCNRKGINHNNSLYIFIEIIST